jgi:hypothetical protein
LKRKLKGAKFMAEFSELPSIEIRGVSIKMDTGDINRISFGGTKNIFNHEEVTQKIAQGGKITNIDGICRYKETEFNFKLAHTIGMPGTPMSHISIKRKTELGKDELVPELFSIMYEIYESVFL